MVSRVTWPNFVLACYVRFENVFKKRILGVLLYSLAIKALGMLPYPYKLISSAIESAFMDIIVVEI